MDYKKLINPPQTSDDNWRQHLAWLEVVSRQLDENIAKRRKQLEIERAGARTGKGGDGSDA